jgi:hypothetical protein
MFYTPCKMSNPINFILQDAIIQNAILLDVSKLVRGFVLAKKGSASENDLLKFASNVSDLSLNKSEM